MVNIPEYVPERARIVWQRIREYYNPANDPECEKLIDLVGDVGCAIYEGVEPLLDEIDKVGMIMEEMRCTFARRFLEEGPLRERLVDLEAIERSVAVVMIGHHGDLLRRAGVLPSDRTLAPGTEREMVRRAYAFWHNKLVVPLLECLQRRREGNLEWYAALMRDDAPALDRGTRVPQLYMQITWRTGVFGTAETMRQIMLYAVRLHESYKPDFLREGEALLGPGRLAGPARMALFMESIVGFEDFMRIGKQGQFVIDWTKVKEFLDGVNGRTWKERAEHGVVRDADLTGRKERTAGCADLPASSASNTTAVNIALEEARDAARGSEFEALLAKLLDGLDTLADSDPEAAERVAGELAEVVLFLRSLPDVALRAGAASAWIRAGAYRGVITREEIAEACGVSVKTVQRNEVEGDRRLRARVPRG